MAALPCELGRCGFKSHSWSAGFVRLVKWYDAATERWWNCWFDSNIGHQNIPFKPASAGSFLPIHFRNKRLNKCRNDAAGVNRRWVFTIRTIHFGRIMAITQSDIDNLNAAIASGTRSVTIGGQTITYGTVDALIRARNDLQKQLAAAAGATTRSRQTYAYLAGRGY